MIICLFAVMHVAMANVNLLDVSLKLNKRTYLSHENIQAQVVVKNNSAQTITLKYKDGVEWLEFNITRNGSRQVAKAKKMSFAGVAIPAGQTVARTVTLTQMYPLVAQGNYNIRARVNPNINGWKSLNSPVVHFDVIDGADSFRRQQGIPGTAGEVVEFRVKTLNKVSGNEMYFQSYDVKKKAVLSTFSMGGFTMVNRPSFLLDQSGHLNVLFQMDAKLFRYLKISHKGKIVDQKIHKIASSGIPKMVENPRTKTVQVWNSIEYNVQAERKKAAAIHNISQRPPFSY